MQNYIPHILVVDDDTKIRSLLTRYLRDNNYYVSVVKDAADAKIILKEFKFDIIILDVMMPGESGISFISHIRKISFVPVILLTAMGEVDDRVNGLEKGADDYLVKPFEPKELLYRIKRIIERTNLHKNAKNKMKFGNIYVDLEKNTLIKNDQIIKLTTGEIKLFGYLVTNLGKVISRNLLAEECDVNERSIDVQIIRLRAKLEENPKFPIYLQTIRGSGYILYEG